MVLMVKQCVKWCLSIQKILALFRLHHAHVKKERKKIPRPSIFTHYESPGVLWPWPHPQVLWPWPHSQVLWPWRPPSLVPGTCAGDEARRPSHCQVFSFLFFLHTASIQMVGKPRLLWRLSTECMKIKAFCMQGESHKAENFRFWRLILVDVLRVL